MTAHPCTPPAPHTHLGGFQNAQDAQSADVAQPAYVYAVCAYFRNLRNLCNPHSVGNLHSVGKLVKINLTSYLLCNVLRKWAVCTFVHYLCMFAVVNGVGGDGVGDACGMGMGGVAELLGGVRREGAVLCTSVCRFKSCCRVVEWLPRNCA
jgi:hypothetical protein